MGIPRFGPPPAPYWLAALASFAVPVDEARACGAFFAAAQTPVPSLAVERVLLAFDRPTETEHFVREIVFRDAGTPFGFVVPTPSRPTVAKVEGDIFRTLESRLPYLPPRGLSASLPAGGGGVGSGRGVQVLETQRIGSFTAFTLAADDAGALDGWLRKNGLEARPESRAWLDHYVRLKFTYVAFRYEPTGAPDRSLHTETVRITFSSPHPFYPYLEPEHDPRARPEAERVVALWFVSQQPMTPIAAVRTQDGRVVWEKPWREGAYYAGIAANDFRVVLPAVPWPDGDRLVVQTFEDQKASRQGWGDVVFVPQKPEELDAGALAKRRALFAVLDPSLEPAP